MISKKFNKSYDDALTQAYLFHTEFLIDQADFEAFSGKFADPYASDFLVLINAADDLPTIENDLNEQTLITSQLEQKMEECRQHFQKLLLHVGFAFPGDDSILKKFGNQDYNDARRVPSKMINLVQDAYREANSATYKAALIAEGFTQPEITKLDTLADELKAKLNEQQVFIRSSSMRADQRADAFNKVWDVMTAISNASKMIFKNSPSKVEFYLLYPEGPGPGPIVAPANLRYNTQYYKIEWDAVENATSYQLEVSSDGVNFSELATTTNPEFSHIPYDVHSWFKCRSRNANGYSEYSNTIQFWYYEPLPAPSNFQAVLIPGHQFKLSWDLIHSVETYKIYISDVPFGEPESVFALLYETSALEYTGSVTPGRRYYFKVTCFNNYQPESGFSSTMYVEVTGV